jgi:hypothetical protein
MLRTARTGERMVRLILRLAAYLKRFYWRSESGNTDEAKHRPRTVDKLAVALNEKSKYNVKPKLAPKKKALMPRWLNGRWELSSFCIDQLDEQNIWLLLRSQFPDRPPQARSDFNAGDIAAVPLIIDPNWVPERHVDICGWPESEDAQASIVQSLIVLATTRLAPGP